MCGIDIAGIEDGVAHAGDASSFTCKSVDAAEQRELSLWIPFHENLACSKRHAVVLSKHKVYIA